MIEVTKEQLLYYFPYRIQNEQVYKNESVLHALSFISDQVWTFLNDPNNELKDADLELNFIDLQADIAQRKKQFQDMQDDLPEDLQKRAEEYQKDRQSVVNEHLDQETRNKYPDGVIPYSAAEDPEKFENDLEGIEDDYSDLKDWESKNTEKFENKMKGISSVKLKNTEPFQKEDIHKVPGNLKKVIRLMLKEEDPDSEK